MSLWRRWLRRSGSPTNIRKNNVEVEGISLKALQDLLANATEYPLPIADGCCPANKNHLDPEKFAAYLATWDHKSLRALLKRFHLDPVPILCPKSHLLTCMSVEGGTQCDACSVCTKEALLDMGSKVHSCIECGFNICWRCYEAADSRSKEAAINALRQPLRTTGQLSMCYLKRVTTSAKCSYTELLKQQHKSTDESSSSVGASSSAGLETSESEKILIHSSVAESCPKISSLPLTPSVGRATAFISHVWGASFGDLVSALQAFEENRAENGHQPEYYWIDVACFNQHNASVLPHDYWSNTFSHLVGSIGRTLAIFTPFDAPVPLKRIWCVWELAASMATGAQLQIIMPPFEHARLCRRLLRDFDSVKYALTAVDLQLAEASVKSDRKKILKTIEQSPGGTGRVEANVRQALQDWLVSAGQHAVIRTLSNEKDKRYADTRFDILQPVDPASIVHRKGPRALQLTSQLGRLCATSKMNAATVLLLRNVSQSFTDALGADHFYSIVVKANFAHELMEGANDANKEETATRRGEAQQLFNEVLLSLSVMEMPEGVTIDQASVDTATKIIRAKLEKGGLSERGPQDGIGAGSGAREKASPAHAGHGARILRKRMFMFDTIAASMGFLQPSDPQMAEIIDKAGH